MSLRCTIYMEACGSGVLADLRGGPVRPAVFGLDQFSALTSDARDKLVRSTKERKSAHCWCFGMSLLPGPPNDLHCILLSYGF